MAPVEEHFWPVSFMTFDLGYFDDGACRLESDREALQPESVTHVPAATDTTLRRLTLVSETERMC